MASETCCDDIYHFIEYLPEYVNLELELITEVTTLKTITSIDTIRFDSLGNEIVRLEERKTVIKNIDSLPIIGAKIGVIRKNKIDEAKKLGKYNEFGLRESIVWIDTNSTSQPVQFNLLQNKEYYIIIVKDGMNTILEPLHFGEDYPITYNMQKKNIYEEIDAKETVTTEITGTSDCLKTSFFLNH